MEHCSSWTDTLSLSLEDVDSNAVVSNLRQMYSLHIATVHTAAWIPGYRQWRHTNGVCTLIAVQLNAFQKCQDGV